MSRLIENAIYYVVGVAVGIMLSIWVAGSAHASPPKRWVTLPAFGMKEKFTHHVVEITAKNALVNTKFKVAIIDTGYDPAQAAHKLKLCATGHYDFATNKPVLASTLTHGSHVGSLIAESLEDVDYCAVIYQVADLNGQILAESLFAALKKARAENPTAVNLSLSIAQSSMTESKLIEELTAHGTIAFVAAGNEKKDFDHACNAFPACYDLPNIRVVGALTPELDQAASYSNYGTKVKYWYAGYYTDDKMIYERGTSFAAPRALGDYVYALSLP